MGYKEIFSLSLVLATFATVLGDYCTKRRYSYNIFSSSYEYQIYCPYGCCGSSYNEYCCLSDTGVIIGIVFGCVALVCFIGAAVFCCLKQRGNRTRTTAVIQSTQPAGGVHYTTQYPNNVSVISNTAGSQYPAWYAGPQATGTAGPTEVKGQGYPNSMQPPPYSTAASGVAQPPPTYTGYN